MSLYNPDSWVLIKVSETEEDDLYKVLGGWSGSYLHGDSWRINSGIDKVEDEGDYWNFIGHTGSVYRCHKKGNGMRMSMAGIWNKLKEKYPDNVDLVEVDEVIQALQTEEQ